MRNKFILRILAASSVTLLITACSSEKSEDAEVAQADASADKEAAPASAEKTAPIAPDADLLATTCGDFLAMLVVADPGKEPTPDKVAMAENAQDELFNVMMWTHGYATAKGGAVSAAAPLNRPWMVDHVGKLAAVCRKESEDGSLRLAEAVAKL